MSQSNLNESSQRSHLDKLIDLLANKLNLQSAVLDDGDDNDKNSCQTNEDIEKIRKLFAARKSKSDKISLSVVTRKILGWKFFIVCLLFGIFHALLRWACWVISIHGMKRQLPSDWNWFFYTQEKKAERERDEKTMSSSTDNIYLRVLILHATQRRARVPLIMLTRLSDHYWQLDSANLCRVWLIRFLNPLTLLFDYSCALVNYIQHFQQNDDDHLRAFSSSSGEIITHWFRISQKLSLTAEWT